MAAKTPAQWKTLFENVPFHRENYYTGPLGPDYTPGGTCLRLWAPTAEAVTVTLYHKGDGGAVLGTEPLVRGAHGVWSVWLPGEQHGRYYTFAVTVDGITVVGERINPTGKKRFQQALREGDMNYILEQAVSQSEAGAQVLDVNVGAPGVDEPAVMEQVVKALQLSLIHI